MASLDLSAAKLPKPPDRPEDYECCQRGCCPCIFDYYWDALDRWKAAVREKGVDPDAVLSALNPERSAAKT